MIFALELTPFDIFSAIKKVGIVGLKNGIEVINIYDEFTSFTDGRTYVVI